MGTLKLKFKEPEIVRRDYDEEADVLYVYFTEPKPCLTLDLGEGILAHYVEEDGELIGFTVMFLREKSKKTLHRRGQASSPARGRVAGSARR